MHLNPTGSFDSLTFTDSGITALFNQSGQGGKVGSRWYVAENGAIIAL
jgi:hypothetical protein